MERHHLALDGDAFGEEVEGDVGLAGEDLEGGESEGWDAEAVELFEGIVGVVEVGDGEDDGAGEGAGEDGGEECGGAADGAAVTTARRRSASAREPGDGFVRRHGGEPGWGGR